MREASLGRRLRPPETASELTLAAAALVLLGGAMLQPWLVAPVLLTCGLLFARLAPPAAILRCDFSRADLRAACCRGVEFRESDLGGAILEVADLRGARLIDVSAARLDLRGANLAARRILAMPVGVTVVSRSSLREADLREADLRRMVVDRVDLSGANLSLAKLALAVLRNVDLTGADLSGANLGGAHLIRANLAGARLDGAVLLNVIYDPQTAWPADFDPRRQGAIRLDLHSRASARPGAGP
jgi:hypothetical protein